MTLGTATTLNRPMMWMIISIKKMSFLEVPLKVMRLKRESIRGKTTPKAFIQEKKKMCQRKINLKVKRLEQMLSAKKFIVAFLKSRGKS